MKIDFYTKVVLTIIAIGVTIPMISNPPITKHANAAFGGGSEMIVTGQGSMMWHLKDGKVRYCQFDNCSGFK